MTRLTRSRIIKLTALLASTGIVFLLSWSLLYPASAQNSNTLTTANDGAASPSARSGGEANADDDKPHLLAASYYSVRGNLTATLMLNNKGLRPLEVRPTLFSMSGDRFDLAPITVEGTSFREIDMREFGIAGTAFEEGSLQLFHRGRDLVLGAQIYLVDDEHNFSFEEKLIELTPLGATRLEAVW